MGHNSKIGYPYLPAREPWRGQDVLQRAWRVTLAGPASDPGGAGKRPCRGRRFGTRKKTSLAGDPAGTALLALAKRAWRVTLAGTADDPGGDGDLALAERAWRATLAGDPGGDPGGTALRHSQTELGGRACRGRRTTLAGTALWHSQKELGGRPWRGRRTTDSKLLCHSQNEPTLAGRRTTALAKALAMAGDLAGTGGDSQNQLGGQIWRGRLCLWRGQLHGGHSGRFGKWTSRTPARTTLLL